MKFEIKNRWNGSVIFTAEIDAEESDCFSVKLGRAVKVAVKEGADLRGADLNGADLSGADLRGADLSGTNLKGVKVYGYKFTRAPIQIYNTKYRIEIWQGFMKIGCEKHTLADWKNFTQKRIIEMDGKEAAIWWKKWKAPLFAIAEAEGRMELPEQESEAA